MSKDIRSIDIDLPDNTSSGRKRKSSLLVEDNMSMERKRRRMEQDGERRFAKVHERSHPENTEVNGDYLEETQDNGLMQHPYMDSPRFDGIDPSVNTLPSVGDANRTKFENERREQEAEKQYRLGNMPRFNNTPKPGGP